MYWTRQNRERVGNYTIVADEHAECVILVPNRLYKLRGEHGGGGEHWIRIEIGSYFMVSLRCLGVHKGGGEDNRTERAREEISKYREGLREDIEMILVADMNT